MQIIFNIIDLTTTTRVSNLKSKLIKANLKDCDQNAKEILGSIEITCNEIIIKGRTYTNSMLNLFNIVETSTNSYFLKFVKTKCGE
jgi:hypothetical protein